jgi:hypothetical protein
MNIFNLLLFSLFSMYSVYCHDFKNCDNNQGLLYVNSINLDPDPPTIGNNLTIKIVSIPKQNITDANGILTVKFLGINILKENLNLCDYVQCPLIEGNITNINIIQNIPNILPSGSKLDFTLDSTTNEKKEITCVELTIIFNKDLE